MAWNDLADPLLYDSEIRRTTLERFHALYYHLGERTWLNTYWLGVAASKCPLDLWIYQEILFEQRPDAIIECGTYQGGSGYFLASICELLGHGRVYSVDIEERPNRPRHARLEYLLGSSTSEDVVSRLRDRVGANDKVMVILDSDHTRDHVLTEMELYQAFVPLAGYLIVEDTNINGHPAFPDFGPGPMEAVAEFLQRHPEFEVDGEREKLLLTFNPRGYLRRVRPSAAAAEAAGAKPALPPPSPVTRPAGAPSGLEARLQDMDDRNRTIDWLHREVATRDDTVAILHREVARRDSTIASLRSAGQNQEDTVRWLHREVAQRDEEVTRLHRETALQQQTIATLGRRCRRALVLLLGLAALATLAVGAALLGGGIPR